MAELILCIDHFAFLGNKMWDVIFFFQKKKNDCQEKISATFPWSNKQTKKHTQNRIRERIIIIIKKRKLKFHAGLMARDQGSVLANRHGIATLLTIISIRPLKET